MYKEGLRCRLCGRAVVLKDNEWICPHCHPKLNTPKEQEEAKLVK